MSERKEILFTDPVEHTGDRERDAMIAALVAVEAREGERRGWDQHAKLWTVHLAHIDSGAVELRPVPYRAWQKGNRNPADDLLLTGTMLGWPPDERPYLSFADAPDGISALAFMCEAWAVDETTLSDKERALREAGVRTYHTNPNRREMRSIVAVDINGNGYVIARMRGQDVQPVQLTEPEFMRAPSGKGPGNVQRALYAMAYAARTTGWPHVQVRR